MSWIVFFWFFEVAGIQQTVIISPPAAIWQAPVDSFSAELGLSARLFDLIEIGGTMRSYQIPAHDVLFAPYRIDYIFDANIQFGIIKIGFRHECDHPVISNFSTQTDSIFASTESSVFVRISGKL